MQLDPTLITGNIVEAYDTFKSLGLEKDVIVQVQNLNKNTHRDYTVKALWLTKDAIRVGEGNKFATEVEASVYTLESNLVIPDPYSPGNTVTLKPNHSQRLINEDDPDHTYSVKGVSHIFNFWVIKLLP